MDCSGCRRTSDGLSVRRPDDGVELNGLTRHHKHAFELRRLEPIAPSTAISQRRIPSFTEIARPKRDGDQPSHGPRVAAGTSRSAACPCCWVRHAGLFRIIQGRHGWDRRRSCCVDCGPWALASFGGAARTATAQTALSVEALPVRPRNRRRALGADFKRNAPKVTVGAAEPIRKARANPRAQKHLALNAL
jgi:hypothetical protein